METADVITLAVTIGLGIISIALAIFAIWLAQTFNDRSNAALDSIKKLEGDIRVSAEVSLAHQKDFSSRMLDSILDQNQYGRTESTATQDEANVIENIIEDKLQAAVMSISSNVEKTVRDLVSPIDTDPQATKRALESIKNELDRLHGAASQISSSIVLPRRLREPLERWRDFPAHYVLLAGIVRRNVTSIDGMNKIEDEFSMPEGYESGIENLIEGGILDGSVAHFTVSDRNRAPLEAWIDRNWSVFSRLIAQYRTKETHRVTGEEREIVKEIVF